MSYTIFWSLISSAITALVTLFGVFIAQRSGHLLFAVAKQEHDLNFRKSVPVIGSLVRLEARQVLNANYRPFHFIVTSVYNYADFPAQRLSGNWRMYSPGNCIAECNVPIRRDALGTTPYQAEQRLIGPNIDEAVQSGNTQITINVDIEFDYFGLPPDRPQHYSARYKYDPKNRDMVQIPNE